MLSPSHTNINNDGAIETALQYTNKYHLYTYGLEARDLFELLHLLLDNNIFTYRNTTYRQIRGLAMGNRLSGTLAILAMDRFERRSSTRTPTLHWPSTHASSTTLELLSTTQMKHNSYWHTSTPNTRLSSSNLNYPATTTTYLSLTYK